jgi:hypothetical protein
MSAAAAIPPSVSSDDERKQYDKVYELLLRRQAMPFLELSALTAMNDDKLHEILSNFEEQKLVRVTDRKNVLDEIVTLNTNNLKI